MARAHKEHHYPRRGCKEDPRGRKSTKRNRPTKFDRRLALSELDTSREQDQSDRDFDDMRFESH